MKTVAVESSSLFSLLSQYLLSGSSYICKLINFENVIESPNMFIDKEKKSTLLHLSTS